jgi:ABC-type antimicrobial peptide transport system permease subunit
MQFVWDWQMLPMRAASWISALLGSLALLLTLSGIYGVVAYLVSQRTQEIGIRLALGATRARVVGYILGKSMKLVSMGIAIGVLLALVASRLLATKIGATIGPFDLIAYFAGPAVITIGAALAVPGPVRRASRVDPSVTLRAE